MYSEGIHFFLVLGKVTHNCWLTSLRSVIQTRLWRLADACAVACSLFSVMGIEIQSIAVQLRRCGSNANVIARIIIIIIIILTYLLTPWSRVLLEKLTGFAANQEIPAFYGTPKFITVLTSARHLSLSWANSIQSPQPLPTSSRSILILSFHLRLGLPNSLFPSGFPTKTLCTPLPSSIRATYHAHRILLDFITRTISGKEYRSLSSSLCNFLHSPVTPSLPGPNILLNTLFSDTLSLCSSRNVSDQVLCDMLRNVNTRTLIKTYNKRLSYWFVCI